MPKVTGIGGLFFRARDPSMLAAWYEMHLGINDLAKSVWSQEAGYTIFGPFAEKTEYFGRPEQQWMVNFRVDDLNAMMENSHRLELRLKHARSGIPRSGASAAFTIRKEIPLNCGSRRRRCPTRLAEVSAQEIRDFLFTPDRLPPAGRPARPTPPMSRRRARCQRCQACTARA